MTIIWTWFFGEEPPFPVLTDYDQLAGYTEEALADWKPLANRTFAWWMSKKREMAYRFENDLAAVGAPDIEKLEVDDLITVLIPSSPIAGHPDTSMIEQTVRDVRAKLPDSEIIIMLDGVRPEQEDRREAYEKYKRRFLRLTHHRWHDVLPIIFDPRAGP